MKPKLSKSRALSTVLTTVIILVASVVLGSGVVLYGASLFQGGTQTESISVSGVKVWVHNTDANGIAIGAAKIRNTGDKVLSVDKIQIRGTDIPFTQWFPDTTISSDTFQQALNHTGWVANSGSMNVETTTPACTDTSDLLQVDVAGPADTTIEKVCADAATGPVGLSPGQTAIIYFKINNGTLTSLDSGANTSVNIFAGKTGAPQSVTVQGKS
ncbi:MAG: hypothetical protein KGZ37_03685 [Nitrosarchaeum sp.]|nr:hypothetical protein [Nitrosarchaeum sp.]